MFKILISFFFWVVGRLGLILGEIVTLKKWGFFFYISIFFIIIID